MHVQVEASQGLSAEVRLSEVDASVSFDFFFLAGLGWDGLITSALLMRGGPSLRE
jgi:hypothetical protein